MPDRAGTLVSASSAELPAADRRRDARRAAVQCGVVLGVVCARNVWQNGVSALSVAFAAIFWGAVGSAAGAATVYLGGAWRTPGGRWNVSPVFAFLAAGTPVAALAGAMLGGTPPSGRGAALFAGAWVAAVLAAGAAFRLRAQRRERAAA